MQPAGLTFRAGPSPPPLTTRSTRTRRTMVALSPVARSPVRQGSGTHLPGIRPRSPPLAPRTSRSPTPLRSRPRRSGSVSKGLSDVRAELVDLVCLGGGQHLAMTADTGACDRPATQASNLGAPVRLSQNWIVAAGERKSGVAGKR